MLRPIFADSARTPLPPPGAGLGMCRCAVGARTQEIGKLCCLLLWTWPGFAIAAKWLENRPPWQKTPAFVLDCGATDGAFQFFWAPLWLQNTQVEKQQRS